MAHQSCEKPEVRKRSCRLAVAVSRPLRDSKQSALRDQRQRASSSIPSHIAGGHERDSRPDCIRFLRIAKGSAAELRTRCHLTRKLEMLTRSDADEFIGEANELSAMRQGPIRSLVETD